VNGERYGRGDVRSLVILALVLTLVACAALVAWRAVGGRQGKGSEGGELRLLVDDELADTKPLLDSFAQEERLALRVDFAPTAEVRRRSGGASFGRTYAGAWLAETAAQSESPVLDAKLADGTVVMSSPLVLGVRAEAAARLTRNGSNPSWQDVARESAAGRFDFGMADPRSDGCAALLGIATGLAEGPDTLSPADVFRVAPQLRAMHQHQTLNAASPTELVRQFQRPQAVGVTGAMVHESQVLGFNAKANAASRLTILAPGSRAVFTNYVLRGALATHNSQVSGLHRLSDYLLTPQSQRWISVNTHRRPAVTGSTDPAKTRPPLREVETPRRPGLLDRLTAIYLGSYRYPSRVAFVVDVSGSMRGQGMLDLNHAFASLTGSAITHRGADVEVLLIPFAAAPKPTQRFVVSVKDPAPGLASLADAVAHLPPGGSTAIYDALTQADNHLITRTGEGDEAVTSIVLITDGKNTAGSDLDTFRRHRQALRVGCRTSPLPGLCEAPTFPVLTGGADLEEMQRLAAITSGTVHDARSVDLAQVLLDVASGR
jgi:Ca-activated chloride channel family protein